MQWSPDGLALTAEPPISTALGGQPGVKAVSVAPLQCRLSPPFWDHVLAYWDMSMERPGCAWRSSSTALSRWRKMVERILKLCSFDHLRGLGVNRNGKLSSGEENNAFFRRREVGEWNNYLSPEMAERIDRISREMDRDWSCSDVASIAF
ncbi:hypothetical protein SASPL_140468 [Salvia splendens]|uniref:Sulfotransferase n=1 Tax=Salvia splendens TaxID=180675 RepID=A0A8X8WQD6_SALSN|nr:hypothetical protein SASPL_140468 [Salvia splendens]